MIQRSDRLTQILLLGLAGICALVLVGCEENVTAVTGTDRAFSFYGVLRPAADTQYVSVYPIAGRLAPTQPDPLEAEVTATDQTTGSSYRLRDSVIQEENGDYAHFFWMPVRAEYGHTYEIRAVNSEDQETAVEVTVPPSASLEIREPSEEYSVGVVNPVFVDGEVPRLMKVEVEYYIKFDEGQPEATTARMTIPYTDNAGQVEGGWMIDVNLSNDYETLRSRLRARGKWSVSYGIAMFEMTIRMAAVNESWNPPGGSFDPEVLVQPGTMSNVDNGFGFVGAGFRLNETWRPDEEYLEAAGWKTL